jgi:AcrR family transcriptional regulator
MQELEQAASANHTRVSERTKHSFSIPDDRKRDMSGDRMQERRERIMRALVVVLAERGFASTTVALVVRRARISNRTFYQCFDGLEECLIAVMDGALKQAVALASHNLEEAECWQDGVRAALVAVLSYFDREPELARVCIVETLAGGPVVLVHRERVIEAFRLLIVQRVEREVPGVSPLAAEGVMSSVLGIMHAHIVVEKPSLFIELLGPLVGLIMAPYLGARAVQREIERGDELAQAILNEDPSLAEAHQQHAELATAPDQAFATNLGSATALHLRKCLLFLATHPDASNREVSAGVGLVHQSQVSRLLSYLLLNGLATKRSEGKGKRNAWRLTPSGEAIARTMT